MKMNAAVLAILLLIGAASALPTLRFQATRTGECDCNFYEFKLTHGDTCPTEEADKKGKYDYPKCKTGQKCDCPAGSKKGKWVTAPTETAGQTAPVPKEVPTSHRVAVGSAKQHGHYDLANLGHQDGTKPQDKKMHAATTQTGYTADPRVLQEKMDAAKAKKIADDKKKRCSPAYEQKLDVYRRSAPLDLRHKKQVGRVVAQDPHKADSQTERRNTVILQHNTQLVLELVHLY